MSTAFMMMPFEWGGANLQLQELGRFVAYVCKAQMVPGPVKARAGALAKLGLAQAGMERSDHYQGDVSKLKDVVRITIVGESPEIYKNVTGKIRTLCVLQNKMRLIKDEERNPRNDPCGYSDTNMGVMLPCQPPGEIQVNNRAILYGKMSQQDFCRDLNVTMDGYEQWRLKYGSLKYGIEGGLGHTLLRDLSIG